MVLQSTDDMNKKLTDRFSVAEGYMFMQSHPVWRPLAYKARYFILTNECLYCFKRRGDLDAVPHDVVHMKNISVSLDELRRGFRKRYSIRLSSATQRKTFNLFCFSVEERNEWFTNILQVLASKYTDQILSNNSNAKQPLKTRSMLDETRYSALISLEQKRPMSISCIELTNLGVIGEFKTPRQTVTPIIKVASKENKPKKKVSSCSLDVSIRSDVILRRTKQVYKNETCPMTVDSSDNKRTKSMCDPSIYLANAALDLNNDSSGPSKRSRKIKTFSTLFN